MVECTSPSNCSKKQALHSCADPHGRQPLAQAQDGRSHQQAWAYRLCGLGPPQSRFLGVALCTELGHGRWLCRVCGLPERS